MKKQIRKRMRCFPQHLYDYLCNFVKTLATNHANSVRDSPSSDANQNKTAMKLLKLHALRITLNSCAIIIVAMVVLSMIPSAIMYSASKLRDPTISWIANSIENEGVVYNALIAIGDYRIIYAIENFYVKRGSSIDLQRFEKIKNIVKTLK